MFKPINIIEKALLFISAIAGQSFVNRKLEIIIWQNSVLDLSESI